MDMLYDDYSRGVEISNRILAISDYKEGLKYVWQITLDYADTYKTDIVGGKSIKKELKNSIEVLSYLWSQYVDIWSEMFWSEIDEYPNGYKRVEAIPKILERGRFRGVGEAMHTRYQWKALLDSRFLLKRYSLEELQKVTYIIATDEGKRLSLLKKCLRNKRLSHSDYLRFGEAIAFFTQGGLFNESTSGTELEKHFTPADIRLLDEIWEYNPPVARTPAVAGQVST
ncbi:MAG: hypothetical protein ABI169_14590 [Chitinophagaceae bacterium]